MATIVTITFSPAIDKSTTVPLLIPEKKLTCTSPVYEPGGGGINVARAIKRLGGNATAIYLAGGHSGMVFTDLLHKEKIDSISIRTHGVTRENLVVKEIATNRQFRFGMPGDKVSDKEWKNCVTALSQIPDIKYIVVSGSLPTGIPADIFVRMAQVAYSKNARLIVDTSGAALNYAVEAGAYLIKPNLKELALLAGKESLTIDQIEEASLEIINKYHCEVVITSLGADGAFLTTRETSLQIIPPQVNIQSTVGAGDSMLAGIVLSLSKNRSLVESTQYGVACGTAATMNQGTELCHLKDVNNLYNQCSLYQESNKNDGKMKAIFYSVKSIEKELLINANHKKHDITLISEALNTQTSCYAKEKDAVVVFTSDDVSAPVINKLSALGVKYIATRSTGTDHIDKEAAKELGIEVANIPAYSPQAIAEHAVALALALSRHLIQANQQCHQFNFSLDHLTGFNFYGKTVGIIGLGHIGTATASIFHGLGCRVLGYDIQPKNTNNIEWVDLDKLYRESDIITLHTPLTPETKYLINEETLLKMKNGVMIINTARGNLIKTTAALDALKNGKIGYLGLDVYEHEKGLFFENHEADEVRDAVLSELMNYPNVLISPHQAFLTKEALEEIAKQTINILDQWTQKSANL